MQRKDPLTIFAKVGETGSVSGAARALRLPKANVSRAVARLEAEYGVSLVDRTGQRMIPTEIGRKLLSRCAIIQEQLAAADAEIASYQGIPSGTLRVGCPASVSAYMAGWLPEFLAEFPQVDLRLKVADRVMPEPSGVDLVLHAGWLTDSSLIASRILDLDMVLVASRGYADDHGLPTTPEGLNSRMVIGSYYREGEFGVPDRHELPARVPVLEVVRDGVRSLVPVSQRFASNDLLLLHELVRRGVAIAPLSRLVVARDLMSGDLVRVLPDHEIVDPPALYVVYSSTSATTPKVRAFIDFISAKARAVAL